MLLLHWLDLQKCPIEWYERVFFGLWEVPPCRNHFVHAFACLDLDPLGHLLDYGRQEQPKTRPEKPEGKELVAPTAAWEP